MFKNLIPFRIPFFLIFALSILVAVAFFSYRLGLDHERAKQTRQAQAEKAQLIKQIQTITEQNNLANRQIVKQRQLLQNSNQALSKEVSHEVKTNSKYYDCLIPDSGMHLRNKARDHASQIAASLPDAALSSNPTSKW